VLADRLILPADPSVESRAERHPGGVWPIGEREARAEAPVMRVSHRSIG
jgi:hypothetical protein